MQLIEFLLACIAEDELAAHEPYEVSLLNSRIAEGEGGGIEVDPSRVLAECRAKREIVEIFAPSLEGEFDPNDPGQQYGLRVVAALAGVYADHPSHPDYRPGRRP